MKPRSARLPWLLLIVALAAASRVAFGLLGPDLLLGLSNDAAAYDRIARSLLSGGGFIDPTIARPDDPYAGRPPLTPFVVAGLYALFGTDPAIPRIAFALIGGLTCLAIFSLGRELFCERAGLLGAGLAAIFPMFIVVSNLTLTENLAVPLVTLAVLFLGRAQQHHRVGDTVVAGLAIGLGALDRSVALVLVPIGLLALLVGARPLGQRLRTALLLAAVATLVVAPWTIRNAVEFQEFIPVDEQGLFTLYLGNNPHFFDSQLWTLKTGQQGSMLPPEEAAIVSLRPPRAQHEKLLLVSLDFMIHNPTEVARFAAFKLWLFWSAYPHPVDAVSWTALAVLAGIGAGASWRTRRRLLILYAVIATITAAHVLTTALPRHRIIIDGLILVLSGAGLEWIVAGCTSLFAKERR